MLDVLRRMKWRLRHRVFCLYAAFKRWRTPRALVRLKGVPSLRDYLQGEAGGAMCPSAVQAESDLVPEKAKVGCSIVVAVRNNLCHARSCLETVVACAPQPYSLIIVDDASDGHTARFLDAFATEYESCRVMRNSESVGAVRCYAQGMAEAGTEGHVVLLDPRTLVTPGWLSQMVACLARDERVGLVSPLSNCAGDLWIRGNPGDSFMDTASALAGLAGGEVCDAALPEEGCIMIRAEALAAAGGFEEAYTLPAFAFAEIARRVASAGFRVVCAPEAYVFRQGAGEAWPVELARADARRFLRAWGSCAPAGKDPLRGLRIRHGRGRMTQVLSVDEAAVYRYRHANEILNDAALDTDVARYKAKLGELLAAKQPRKDSTKIVFLLNVLHGVGGVLSVAQLVNDLILQGMDVKVVVRSPQGFDSSVPLLTEPILFSSTEELIAWFPKADLVIGTLWSTMYYLMRVFLQSPTFVPAYFVQDFEPYFYPESEEEMRRRIEATYTFTPYCFAKTPWICEKVRGCGGQIAEIPPALDLDLFYPRDAADTSDRKVVLTMFRPRTPWRGFETAVAVFSSLFATRRDFDLHTFGTEDVELEGYDIPFDYVNHGRVSNESLPDLYSRANLFVDCSDFHGFGRTIAEAMACGTPCVVTDSGGVGAFARDGYNCLIAPPRNAEALAEKIGALMDDGPRRNAFAANCRESVSGFDRRYSSIKTAELLLLSSRGEKMMDGKL